MAKTIKRIQFDPPGQIEIFYVEDGSTEWQKFISDADYQEFLLERQTEIDNGVPPAPTPNWVGFNTAMFQNAAYNRIRSNTSNQLDGGRVEALALSLAAGVPFNMQIFAVLWNNTIAGSETPPTAEEAAGWRAIASTNNMPFTYNQSGLIEVS
ncbi:hypothetical protein ACX27_04145 [Nostoc piscinale CENA21]|uniref:Uncharacterized protein n=1 Tax=Nostoc piscinale CENA21 TaxID=224013 RepID=A0A0M5MG78_9NOSO|nr:hypothetical protein [Nostoc piscinale]ALF52225.1 hypothetical protein ACX27_04145 [Nostoc piscinale CENA21]